MRSGMKPEYLELELRQAFFEQQAFLAKTRWNEQRLNHGVVFLKEQISKLEDELLEAHEQLFEKQELLSKVKHVSDQKDLEVTQLQRALSDAETRFTAVSNSRSYKIGRMVTWPIRLLHR